jgi:ubiquinol-cytochrome c reductase cytochrome c1 subunit
MKKHFLLPMLLCMFSSFAVASSEVELDLEKIPTDRASVLRGAEQTAVVCGACHGLKYIQYRNLLELGVAKETVDAWRGDKPLNTAMQPQMPADAAQAAFGVVPPDLSLMTLAREGGVHYMYSYLMGYKVNDKGDVENRIFSVTKMPDILGIAAATDDAQRATISAQAKDITAFLNWAADPHAEDRKTLGIYVMIYLFIMTILLFLWKKQIWRKVDAMGPV